MSVRADRERGGRCAHGQRVAAATRRQRRQRARGGRRRGRRLAHRGCGCGRGRSRRPRRLPRDAARATPATRAPPPSRPRSRTDPPASSRARARSTAAMSGGASGRTSRIGPQPLGEMLHHHRRRVRCLERQLAGEHQVADDAERIDVAAAVGLALAERLLGRHVRRRADRDARDRELRVALGRARDAEVGDHRAPALAIDQNVLRLDVAVHDAVARARTRARPRPRAARAAPRRSSCAAGARVARRASRRRRAP